MSGSRTVAVLGPIPHDHITTHRGETFEKYGCVIYTVAALSTLLGPDDRVCPIVHVRRMDEDPIKDILAPFPNVDVTGIRSTSDRGDLVELSYVDQNKRIERQTGFMTPILPEDVEFALDADAFVCVPIADYQVSQATLAFIRQHSNGLILLDAHGPTISLTRGGARVHRLWIDRDSWLPNVDVLKMNVEKTSCSWFPSQGDNDERAIGEPLPTSELRRFAEHCLRHGVQAVCVTLDEQGCVVYFRDFHRRDAGARRRQGACRRSCGHHRMWRLLRRRHGIRIPGVPRLRDGVPVWKCGWAHNGARSPNCGSTSP